MLITIISDASWDPNTKACGWSFWLASGRGKKGGQGHETEPIINNNAAESIAIFKGVLGGCNEGLIHPGDSLILQTDCDAAILAFQRKRKSITPQEVKIVEDFETLVKGLSLRVEFRHVKGHTRGDTPRTWINNKCDEFAGIEMRKAKLLLKKLPAAVDNSPPWD